MRLPIVMLALLLLLPACREGSAGAPAELVGIDWRLVELVDDGRRAVVPSDRRWVLAFDGDRGFSLDGCNDYEGRVAISGDAMGPTQDVVGTEIYCGEDGLDPELLALVDGSSWSRTGARLELTNDEIHATFERRQVEWPETIEHVLLEERKGPQFQVGWSTRAGDVHISYHGRSQTYGPWGHAGSEVALSIGKGEFHPFFAEFDGRLLAFGAVNREASRAEFRPSGGGATSAVQVFELPGRRKVVAGLVKTSVAGRLFVLDDVGSVVNRSREYRVQH